MPPRRSGAVEPRSATRSVRNCRPPALSLRASKHDHVARCAWVVSLSRIEDRNEPHVRELRTRTSLYVLYIAHAHQRTDGVERHLASPREGTTHLPEELAREEGPREPGAISVDDDHVPA